MEYFNAEEKEIIKEVFNANVTSENIADYLPKEIFDFLKQKQKLKTRKMQFLLHLQTSKPQTKGLVI